MFDRLEPDPHPKNSGLYIPAEERERLARKEVEKRRQPATAEAETVFGSHPTAEVVTDAGEVIEE